MTRPAMQRGTTLTVGLMLLALVTLLALAGASAARVEYRLALNERFRENAAFAASAGIELFQRRLMNSTPDAAPLTLRGTVPGTASALPHSSCAPPAPSRSYAACAARAIAPMLLLASEVLALDR